VTRSVHQAREALGHRLRDIRKDAGLTGRQLALLAGWPNSKVSKIEYGRQTPTEAQTYLFRWYEPVLVPGILHTAEYAAAVMSRVIDFYGIPDDLPAGVAARMERQQILYRGDHRFHFILAEQALRTTVGSPEVMAGQLDRLHTIVSLPRVSLGVIPARANYQVPTNQFIMFDDRLVHVESISAELTISQPREISLYAKAFQELTEM
jgi:hypothetical protein